MASIWDFLPPGARQQAAYSGLMNMAGGLMQGGAPSTQPGGGMRGLGLGLGGFNQGYQGSINSAAQQGMMATQLAEFERKNKQREMQEAAINQMFVPPAPQMAMAGNPQAGPTQVAAAKAQPPIAQMFPGQDVNMLRTMAQANPEGFMSAMQTRMMPKEKSLVSVAQGAALVDPNTNKAVFTNPKEAPAPSEFEKALAASNYKPGTPEYEKANRDFVARKGLPMQVTNQVELKQENAEAAIVGKNFGEIYTGLVNAEMKAPSQLGKLDRLESLLSKTYTGMGAEQVQAASKALKAAGDAAGVNTSGLSEKIGAAEGAQALANEMALELRNPAGGAGMPGAMSDSDREFLKSMTSGLSTTPEGRKQIVETRRRLIKREQQVAKMARDYRRKHKSLDEGFFDDLAEFSEKNPLFADMAPQQAEAPAGDGWQVIDGVRIRRK
jgi:hypothetical protein